MTMMMINSDFVARKWVIERRFMQWPLALMVLMTWTYTVESRVPGECAKVKTNVK